MLSVSVHEEVTSADYDRLVFKIKRGFNIPPSFELCVFPAEWEWPGVTRDRLCTEQEHVTRLSFSSFKPDFQKGFEEILTFFALFLKGLGHYHKTKYKNW